MFLCTINVQSAKTIKKIPFMGVSQKMKYLGINQTKEVKDLYRKNCETLHKEVKDTNKLKENPCSWIGKLNIIKLSILPTVIYRFNEMCIKIPKAIFSELEKNSKIHMEFQRTPPPIAILNWKNKTGGLTLPDFKISYKATIFKTVWYWHKYSYLDLWNRIETRNKPSHVWSNVFGEDCQDCTMGKRIDSLTNGVGKLDIFFFFFLEIHVLLFIYLFIYDCVEPSFLCEGFL